ncbi:MAG: KamA family radical SAM protein [Planctomycetaceae bacterium]|jgi:EF-P beta-lysylation protein EpmB|nr:KamA family radical SAM protein [Planctomycetaceae bacterium]
MSESDFWQKQLQDAVTDPAELVRSLRLPEDAVSAEAARRYPVFVTRSYLRRMEPGNLNDPLLLQVLPREAELSEHADFCCDPLGELENPDQCPDVLQKYQGRVLLLTTDSCAVHCRFCFRRHFPKKHHSLEHVFTENRLRNPDMREVILSGGDPLMLTDRQLKKLFYYMEELPHVNRVRVHTRLPVMIPERVTEELLGLFQKFRQSAANRSAFLVLHVNHPNELAPEVLAAVGKMADSGMPVLSQTVLLKGINDNFATLFELFEKLVNNRAIPYYLHQLDRVAGASHFEVPMEQGLCLLRKLQDSLPGFAVPRYVQETAGMPGKVHLPRSGE